MTEQQFDADQAVTVACKLAALYYDLTEQHDRSFMTGPIVNGEIIPANAGEMAKGSIWAIVLHRDIQRAADALGIPDDFLRAAMRRQCLLRPNPYRPDLQSDKELYLS